MGKSISLAFVAFIFGLSVVALADGGHGGGAGGKGSGRGHGGGAGWGRGSGRGDGRGGAYPKQKYTVEGQMVLKAGGVTCPLSSGDIVQLQKLEESNSDIMVNVVHASESSCPAQTEGILVQEL